MILQVIDFLSFNVIYKYFFLLQLEILTNKVVISRKIENKIKSNQ